MCLMCEGFSLDDALALDAARLDRYGFIIQGVGSPAGGPHGPEWVYTVGLLDRVGHPELIVAGPGWQRGGDVLHVLAHAVLDGERFEVGETIRFDGDVARVGAVDPVQYELDTFNTWHNLRSIGVLQTAQLEAVQIVVPDDWMCGCHTQPVLADPAARILAPRGRAHRAARRAPSRRRRPRRNGPRP